LLQPERPTSALALRREFLFRLQAPGARHPVNYPGSRRHWSHSQDPLPDRYQLEWLVASCAGLAWVLGDSRLHFVDHRADDHLDQLGRKSRFLSAYHLAFPISTR
jgi:hypothetical protein